MPRVEFTEENKVATTNYDYPKLKLKKEERARILLLEAPLREYVHTLRAPAIKDGHGVMETKQKKNGEPYQVRKLDFLSRPLCLGDEAILAKDGLDPQHCPMCKLAKENPDMTDAPQRRYAMHVIRYATKGGTYDPITPFSVQVLVYAFTDKVFNQIADFKNEWGDLRKHDLTLICTNEDFQGYDLSVAAKAAWLESKERQTLVLETFKNNQIPDLSIACGQKKEMRWIEQDISVIREKWAVVSNDSGDALDSLDNGASLSEGLDSILNGDGSIPNGAGKTDAEGWAESAPADTSVSTDDLLASIDTTPASTDTTAAAEATASEDEGVDLNFEDLLADIDK